MVMTTLACPERCPGRLNHIELDDGASILECVTEVTATHRAQVIYVEHTGCGYWTILATSTVARLTTRAAA